MNEREVPGSVQYSGWCTVQLLLVVWRHAARRITIFRLDSYLLLLGVLEFDDHTVGGWHTIPWVWGERCVVSLRSGNACKHLLSFFDTILPTAC